MKYIKQMSIIFTISLIAEVMEFLIPLPIAASVYGLILMLIGLFTKLIPIEKVENAADFLIEIMPIMFVPSTVSIMTRFEQMKQMLVPLLVISAVSTFLVFAATGKVAQAIMKRKGAKGLSKRR